MKTAILKNIKAGMLLILLISVVLSSCARSEPNPPEEISISWSEIDQGVGLEVGTILEIVLPAQPSTGYIWEVDFFNQSVLEPYGEPEFSATSSIPGGEESQILHFKAIDEGETELVLVYRRSYEEKGTDQRTWQIFVTVRQKVSDDRTFLSSWTVAGFNSGSDYVGYPFWPCPMDRRLSCFHNTSRDQLQETDAQWCL